MNKDEFVRRQLEEKSTEPRAIPRRIDETTWFLKMRSRGEMHTASLERWYYAGEQEEFFGEYEKQMKERDEKA
jgi:hypothetical protein